MMVTDDLLRRVAKQALVEWDLSVTEIALISKSENIVFRLDTDMDQTYVLRMHRPGYHTLAELNAEQQWTAALNQAGLDVPVPKMTVDGRGYTCVSMPGSTEERHVGIVEWFEGEPLSNMLKQTSDKQILVSYFDQLGRIAARIHNQAIGWQIPAGFQRHAFDADGLMGNAPFWGPFWDLPMLTKAERKRILSARASIYRILSDYGKEQGTYSLIHSDLHPGNLLVNGEQLHVIDFDDSGFGWHQYELAVALYHYQDSPHFNLLFEALIAGYRVERPFDDAAVELVSLFFLIRAMASIGWTYARPELELHGRLPGLIARVCEQADALGL